MNKLIILPHGLIKKLSLMFECSRFTVSKALHTDDRGRKKDAIRAYVRENYGSLVPGKKAPE